MNILFLTPRLPYPPHRGDKQHIYNLIKQLSANHTVTLLSFTASADERAHLPALRKYCREVITVSLPPWRSMLNCLAALPSATPFQVAYYASDEMRKTLKETLARGSFDILHVHLIRMAQYAAERQDGLFRVLDPTDAGSLYLERFLATTDNIVKRAFLHEELSRLRRYEQILEKFDVSTVCSEIDRDVLLRHAPKAAIELLYNGIDLEYFSAGETEPANGHSLIFTGNMTYFPNEDGMVYFVQEILPLVRACVPDVQLAIVGQNPTAKVRHLAGPGVLVTGFVPDIKEYYLRNAIAIAPIRFGAGTRIKILEPMALGIPVVSTTIGAEGLPVEHGRDILIADTPQEFADALVRLMNDGALRQTIGRSGKAVVRERYDWHTIAQILDGIYRRLQVRQQL